MTRKITQYNNTFFRIQSSRSLHQDATIEEAAKALANHEITAVELTEKCISQIEKTRRFNMFVTDSFEQAREAAKASDKRRKDGKTLGPLDGIPVASKDNFCTKGVRTTVGSKMLKGINYMLG